MRILVLHSDVAPDAPPDEQDTLYAADCVASALRDHSHAAELEPFRPDPAAFDALLARSRPDVVFNLVEAVDGLGSRASAAPRMLEDAGVPFTGADALAMAVTTDKPLTKRRLRDAGVATPAWSTPPHWRGLCEGTYIVKSTLEDASVGLDDAAIVCGADAAVRRADESAKRWGGQWFAEAFIDGREFNIAMIDGPGGAQILPMAEMRFENWPEGQPRIVGYIAKWDEHSFESDQTVRHFGVEANEPALAAKLREMCLACWRLFDLSGYARVDFRVDAAGRPYVLEINTNPAISPDAGLPAAGLQAGLAYDRLILRIVEAAGYRK